MLQVKENGAHLMWLAMLMATACVTYRTSIQMFWLPRQEVLFHTPKRSSCGYVTLRGLVNVEREPVTFDASSIVFGPNVQRALRRYKCQIHSIRRDDDAISLDMSILRVPKTITLWCADG